MQGVHLTIFFKKYCLNRTSGHADFQKPGKNYPSLSCDAPPDKSKQLRLIHVIYEYEYFPKIHFHG